MNFVVSVAIHLECDHLL